MSTTKTRGEAACDCWVTQRRESHEGHCCLDGGTECGHVAVVLGEAYRLAGGDMRRLPCPVWEATSLRDRGLFIALAYQGVADGDAT